MLKGSISESIDAGSRSRWIPLSFSPITRTSRRLPACVVAVDARVAARLSLPADLAARARLLGLSLCLGRLGCGEERLVDIASLVQVACRAPLVLARDLEPGSLRDDEQRLALG